MAQQLLLSRLQDPDRPLAVSCQGDFVLDHLVRYLVGRTQITRACTVSDITLLIDDCQLHAYGLSKLKRIVSGCQEPFIVMPLSIGFRTNQVLETEGHANVLLIDRVAKTVERFEPHGLYTRVCNGQPVQEMIDQYVQSIPFLQDYKYIPPLTYCPVLGPQTYHPCNEGGFCNVFTALYIHLRLLEPDVPRETVIEKMLTVTREELLRYLYWIQSLLPTRAQVAEMRLKR